MKAAPRVYVVVLNWNGHVRTARCLRSLQQVTYLNHEILLVDNGSTDGSADVLSAEFPACTMIRSDTNLGYAGGNNLGIRYSLDRGADYVLLLNNDTTVDAGFLEPLVTCAEEDPRVGLCGGKVYVMDHPSILDSVGGGIDLWFGRAYGHGHGEVDRGQFDRVREVDYVGGACVLIARRVFETIGLLPTHYFMYYEETDFSLAARRAGFSAVSVPTSRIWHEARDSRTLPDPTGLYYIFRSQVLFVRRYATPAQWSVYFLFRYLLFFPIYALQLAMKDRRLARALGRAFWEGLTRPPPPRPESRQ